MFNVMNQNKFERNRSHHRVKREVSHKPNYALRRLVAGTAVAGAGILGFNAVRADDEGSFHVDRTQVEAMDPAERAKQYDAFRIDSEAKPEELGVAPNLHGIAEEYKTLYGLDSDVRDITADLVDQNGGSALVHPGDVFYLPHRETPDQP